MVSENNENIKLIASNTKSILELLTKAINANGVVTVSVLNYGLTTGSGGDTGFPWN